jgi:integrase
MVAHQDRHRHPRSLRVVGAAACNKWQPLFATAIHTGGRKGELLDLRNSDVDLNEETLAACSSNGNDTTKGGHADVLPIADDLVPYLRAAMDASPSELVFPAPDGRRHRHDIKLQKILRKALVKAGIVVGFDHRCRGPCPKCSKPLWVKAVPRPIRFHNPRNTTATLLLKADVSLATVQRILRHTDPAITSEVDGHLDLEDMRKAVNKLSFSSSPTVVP